jgi:hypothetical protein
MGDAGRGCAGLERHQDEDAVDRAAGDEGARAPSGLCHNSSSAHFDVSRRRRSASERPDPNPTSLHGRWQKVPLAGAAVPGQAPPGGPPILGNFGAAGTRPEQGAGWVRTDYKCLAGGVPMRSVDSGS